MVKVNKGTNEYQQAVFEAKNEILRLHKGMKMMNKALEANDLMQAKKLMDRWYTVAQNAYYKIELATLIHQHYITKNSVVVSGSGQPVDIKNTMDPDNVELDPWTLQTLVYLKELFGEDVHSLITIEADNQNSEEEKSEF